ncbi:MAG: hypothetical protein WAN48_09760 [Actinomycetes bacterium]
MLDSSVSRRGAGPHSAAYWLGSALTAVVFTWTVMALLLSSVFKDPAASVGSARGTALTLLVVAFPVLLAGMALTARGSARGPLLWTGSLAYIAYNMVLFTFGVTFNRLFLLFVASLSLAVWSLVVVVPSVDRASIEWSVSESLPRRSIASFVAVVTTLFGLVWLKDIVPGLVDDARPAGLEGTVMLVNPIEVLDLGFTIPLAILAAVWLWRRRSWGVLLSGLVLVMLTIESISIAVDQWFASMADPEFPSGAVALFVVLTLVTLIPLIALLRCLHSAPPNTTR